MTTVQVLRQAAVKNQRNVIRLKRLLGIAQHALLVSQRRLRAAEHAHTLAPMRGFADVSSYQGQVNVGAYAHYYDAIAVKITEGTSWIDPSASRTVRLARAYGVPLAVYHFGHPGTNDPKSEAQHCVKTLKALGGLRHGDVAVVLDCEVTKLSPQATTNWVNDFHGEVHRLTGYPQWLYTYTHFIQWAANLVYQHVWGADYGAIFQPPQGIPAERVIAWQYADNKHVVGVGGPCDFSAWRIDRAAFNRLRV